MEWKDLLDHRLELALGGPLERGAKIGVVAAVTTDEALLLDEKRPEVQRHFAPRCRAASHHSAAARKTVEDAAQHLAADVLHHEIHAALARELAHVGGPVGQRRVHGELRAELQD